MAATIDEAMLIAWVDGELGAAQAAAVAAGVAADPALAARAGRHRRMKARFAAAFDPIAAEPAAMPTPVISLAAARARRDATIAKPAPHRWRIGAALAASLVAGVLVGRETAGPAGLADRPGALALSGPVARALDDRLAGDSGAVRVALSFTDRDGRYCRSFAARTLAGVACHDGAGWQLRYASPASAPQTAYRMAADDAPTARFSQSAIAGDPLDHDAELKARANHWRR